MKQPETILPNGTRVRTHKELKYSDSLGGSRREDESGTINGVVGGMGGDVYYVDHGNGTWGAYCFDEFELETESDSARETKIADVDGDELLVTWDLFQDSKAAVIIEPLRSHCAALDLAGIAVLRAAIDKAEAAYLKRLAKEPDGIIPEQIAEFDAPVTLDVSGFPTDDILTALVRHYGSREAVPVRVCAAALRTERIMVPVVLYANGVKAIRARRAPEGT